MSQIIVASACLIGLIALGLVFVRFYREAEDADENVVQAAPAPTREPTTGIQTRHTVNGFTDRQIAQQARRLTQEVEQFLADQSHCD